MSIIRKRRKKPLIRSRRKTMAEIKMARDIAQSPFNDAKPLPKLIKPLKPMKKKVFKKAKPIVKPAAKKFRPGKSNRKTWSI